MELKDLLKQEFDKAQDKFAFFEPSQRDTLFILS